MPKSQIWKLIQRYIAGQCTEKEQKKLEQWMDKDPVNRQLVQDISHIWEMSSEEEFDVNVQDAWETFHRQEIRQKNTNVKHNDEQSVLTKQLLPVFRAAAAILLVVFVGWFSWQYLDNGDTQKVASQTVMQTLETGNGERAQLTFSDGTVVTLNAASRLQYPKAFKESQRKVKLKGEAYFEVSPNKDRPFVVDAGMAKVEVLGTKFNVRAWSGNKEIGVGVREGKVAVDTQAETTQKKNRVLLNKGEYASVIKGQGLSEVKKVDIEKHMLWLSGGIYFNNAPFSEVVEQIERSFNVNIEVSDKTLLNVPFTGTFQQAKVREVLDVISASMGINYTRTDSLIQF